ncbi:oxidoreductase of aldo-keto reductase family subgroup [Furfurilactobacillus rossiae]|uniref:aldo/keto reductase n=1 Tax=Furfurilactobacillus rossiae TaxID=231049 RepID=UPI0015C06998|nr:aldo/keto reductase [Furfurilactobacillus rossiae]MCF6165000.1 aldo/keto reductase [Furfurilactobacillus rossiae]QLE64072.1 oxidoreductase of aldo-keto reductase family subgroup [Furfurilactobacillus rossiae]
MSSNIPNITLSNGVEIPQIGLGVFRVNDPQVVVDSVVDAVKAGYRHIDTASFYGNEAAVGDGVRQSGVPRQDLFVTSKVWNNIRGYQETIDQFNRSLSLLGFDYLDLYLIHWPAAGYEENWRAMEDLYHAGKIRAIGVSNFEPRHIEHLTASATVAPMIDQVETHPYLQQNEVHEYCEINHIVHEAWSPLGGGKSDVLSDPVIVDLAAKHHKSAAQIVLRWHVQRGEVVIPKSVHQQRIEENADVFDFSLTPEEMRAIAALDRNGRVGSDPNDEAFLKRSTTYDNQNHK